MNEEGDFSRSDDSDELRREVCYLRQTAEQTAARLMQSDLQAIAIRHELEQKRRGFALLAELAVSLKEDTDYEGVFVSVSRRINSALNMQRTAIIVPVSGGGFRTSVLQGYTDGERQKIAGKVFELDQELFDPLHPVLITGADPVSRLADLREGLLLPFCISAPVYLHGAIAAILVTGRLVEEPPFLSRLGKSDVETVQAVSAYLVAMLTGYRLRQAEMLANYDSLTQLLNSRSTKESLRYALQEARRNNTAVAVLFIDLDNFKEVNDTYGHAVGDMVLRIVSERLLNCVRDSDFVGRIGGDEFVVILPRLGRKEDAGSVANKIIGRVVESINIHGVSCQVGASIGIALYPGDGMDETKLLQSADSAMYLVKDSGRNGFRYAS